LFDVTDYPVLFTPTMFLPNTINIPKNQPTNIEVKEEKEIVETAEEPKKEETNYDWDV